MQKLMERLDGFINRRRRIVVGAWILAVLVAAPLAVLQNRHLTEGGFESPGYGSDIVSDLRQSEFGPEKPNAFGVVLRRAGADRAEFVRAVDRFADKAAGVEHIAVPADGRAAAKARAEREDVVMFPLTVYGGPDESINAAGHLRDALGVRGEPVDGVQPYVVGGDALWGALHDLQTEDVKSAEAIGLPITLIILLATFGSLAAAALPFSLGIATVTITLGCVFFIAQLMPMSIFVTSSASMLGIGVAIDYSLFVLARYRQELRAGRDEVDARRVAMRGSGLAVAFSGVTVVVALSSMLVINSTTARSLAIGAIIVVVMSVLAAVTLLPAILGVMGRRAYARGRIGATKERFAAWRARRRRPGAPEFWSTWTRTVMRRPLLAATAAAAILLTIAVPALFTDVGERAAAQFPPDHEAREGMALAGSLIGVGALGPIEGIATFESGDASTPANRRALDAYIQELERDPRAAYVTPPRVSRDGRTVAFDIVPHDAPEGDETLGLLERVRGEADAGSGLARVAEVHYGGQLAFVEDFTDLIVSGMLPAFLVLLALTYVVLLLMLRSVILPIKAIAMNLLTVAAAAGVLVIVFQWGWLDPLLGYESPQYIEVMTPPMVLAVVFGLSMDYEIFMLTRIREAYTRTGDNQEAVAAGLRATAGTISSAALIMVSVFMAFALVSVPSIKEIGVGLGVAIALDATLVRLVLVPATMALLGRWNWWMPGWLDRILPRFEIDAPEPVEAAPAGLATLDGASSARSASAAERVTAASPPRKPL